MADTINTCFAACQLDESCVEACALEAGPHSGPSIYEIGGTIGLLFMSALCSGLTLGLMSLDIRELEVAMAGSSQLEKQQAERIYPLRKRGNLLLCTLLLANTVVNSGIAILTASFTSGVVGTILSTGFILIFGEIIPQSVCSRYGLAAGAKTADLVRIMVLVLSPIAWPLSKMLDRALGEELGTIYSRKELKELLNRQARGRRDTAVEEGKGSGRENMSDGRDSSMAGIREQEATFMCGVLSLSERTAEMIMTKLPDVFALYTDERLDFPLMSKIYLSGYTRIPIFKRLPPMAMPKPVVGAVAKGGGGGGTADDPAAGTGIHPPSAAPAVPGASSKPQQPSPSQQRQQQQQQGEQSMAMGGGGAAAEMTPSSPAAAGGGSSVEWSPACGLREAPPDAAPAAAPAAAVAQFSKASSLHSSAGSSPTIAAMASPEHVAGLLSSKDLILIDPEDALSIEQLLGYCGREVMMVWDSTTVNDLFKEFTRGNSHLAFVQRRISSSSSPVRRTSIDEKDIAAEVDGVTSGTRASGVSFRAGSGDERDAGRTELVGIVTLEDVLEELIQAEIVDESDTVTDNVRRAPVTEDIAAQQRRLAFNAMLDPQELYDKHLDTNEINAVSSFLAANVEAFNPLLISTQTLQELLSDCEVTVATGEEHEPPPFSTANEVHGCTVVLQGRLHVVCGSEGFESDRGPWTVLGAPSLRSENYVADFTAKVMEPSRLLHISRVDYEHALRREAETLAAAVRAAAAESAARERSPTWSNTRSSSRDSQMMRGGSFEPQSPVARVACTLENMGTYSQGYSASSIGSMSSCSSPPASPHGEMTPAARRAFSEPPARGGSEPGPRRRESRETMVGERG